ncbi:hypothetical protein GCM10010327_32370 [Streptomyces nitrosporeus]|nr:hypothetical protein GCM10010327_32370 [Streptomyces nitrosporeus]
MADAPTGTQADNSGPARPGTQPARPVRAGRNRHRGRTATGPAPRGTSWDPAVSTTHRRPVAPRALHGGRRTTAPDPTRPVADADTARRPHRPPDEGGLSSTQDTGALITP